MDFQIKKWLTARLENGQLQVTVHGSSVYHTREDNTGATASFSKDIPAPIEAQMALSALLESEDEALEKYTLMESMRSLSHAVDRREVTP